MIPLIVNRPDPMVRVRVMTLKDYSTQTLKTLHTIGVLHVEESEELKPIDKEAIERERKKVNELLTSINDVLAYVPKGESVSLGEDLEVIYARPLDEIDGEVRVLCTKLGKMHQIAAKLNNTIEELKELTKYLSSLGQQSDIKLRDLSFSGNYLFSRVFVFPTESFDSLYSKLGDYLLDSVVTTIESETLLYAIAKVESRESIESIAKEGGGKILQIPEKDLTIREFLEAADGNIRGFEQELAKLRTEIESKTKENLERLVLFREALSAEAERLAVLAKACEARYVTLIGGWIPKASAEDTISRIKEKVDYVFVDSREPQETEEPPTKLRNFRALRPFQVVVKLFGVPLYKEWDPTPIIAYSFPAFFGLMLNDVAYAAILLLFANRGLRMFVDDPESEGFKLFQRMLYVSGGVGLVFGLLTGSYFGDFYRLFGIESLALAEGISSLLGNPLWFIILSLFIGLIHVNIAHLLTLIKIAKEGKKKAMVGKAGLFLLEIGAIPWIIHNMLRVDIPVIPEQAYPFLLYLAGSGLILIVVSSLSANGIILGGVFSLSEVTGILGDIMSYCRLAGVGLATYYLAFSFNLMATILPDLIPGTIRVVAGPLLAVLILLIGHVINAALSGISCFVHSLRLCFVEFLLKFYEGGGREYSPFRLKTRPVFAKART
ncbi:MAG: V-type ATP synthase subunit I [Dehalococcoidia bacterium]